MTIAGPNQNPTGTTLIAVPELRRYAPDLLRMVGISPGQSDEVADMLVWVEAVHGGAIRFVREHRARLLWSPRPRPLVVSEDRARLVVDLRGGSLLEFGQRILDYACAEVMARGRVLMQVEQTYGELFTTYLAAKAADRGIELQFSIDRGPQQTGRLTVRGRPLDPEHTRETVMCRAYRQAVASGIEMAEEDFFTVTNLFEMLRVPTSERSRTHAG